MAEIIFKMPAEEDIGQVLSLFSLNDPERKTMFTREYWNWQFVKIPGGSKMLAAYDRDKVIGFGALLGFYAVVDGSRELVYEGVEFVVHPEYRGRGVFTNIAARLYDSLSGRHHTYAFASKMSFDSYQKKLAHKYYGTIPYWIGLVKPLTITQNKIGKIATIIKPFVQTVALRAIKTTGRYVTKKDASFDSSWDNIETWPVKSRFQLIKDARYINWRYLQHPLNKYNIVTAYDDDGPTGFIVLCGQNLVDVAYKNEEALLILFNEAFSHFKDNGTLMVNAYLALDKAARAIIRRCGYWDATALQDGTWGRPFYPQQRTVVKAKITNCTFPQISQWYFTMGDMDCKL